MKSLDFEYDGATLSSFGYMICEFNADSFATIDNGSQITFNTVSLLNGEKYEVTNSTYETCLEITFQICKIPVESVNAGSGDTADDTYEKEISTSEMRMLMRWLNRKGFHKFKLLDDDYSDFYFEGSFNISRIEVGCRLVGLELNFITNRPFAVLEPVTINLENTTNNGSLSFNDISDEEGYIYPYTEIVIAEDGDLNIYSELEDRNTYIANCTAGELITFDYPMISTSVSSHEIQNDFNWKFPRIANTFDCSENNITVSIPCSIKMTYSPVVKVGL
ncbi:MAG: hypothetical protein LUG91_00120 [Ruminococcus sp.]|nr:hypothetical protein [Ruminococcus sp.]